MEKGIPVCEGLYAKGHVGLVGKTSQKCLLLTYIVLLPEAVHLIE